MSSQLNKHVMKHGSCISAPQTNTFKKRKKRKNKRKDLSWTMSARLIHMRSWDYYFMTSMPWAAFNKGVDFSSTGTVTSPSTDERRKKKHSNNQEEGEDQVEKSCQEKLSPQSAEVGSEFPGRPGVCDHVMMLNYFRWSVSKLPSDLSIRYHKTSFQSSWNTPITWCNI